MRNVSQPRQEIKPVFGRLLSAVCVLFNPNIIGTVQARCQEFTSNPTS